MRTYEAMCVFRADPEVFSTGKDVVREALVKLGADIQKEEDMGVRTLAFPIKNQLQAHYFYYVCSMDPEKAHETEDALRLKEELLRFMMVRRDD